MKGVADFILAVLNYSGGEYTPDEIEQLILLIDCYEERPSEFKLIHIKSDDDD